VQHVFQPSKQLDLRSEPMYGFAYAIGCFWLSEACHPSNLHQLPQE
jgi:hypothetical protein